jgi:hypothetical protein
MKNTKLNLIVIAVIALLLTVVNSCNVEEKLKTDPQSGKDYVEAESTFSNVYNTVSDAVQFKNLNKSSKVDTCPQITVTAGGFPRTLTITFDNTVGCDIKGVNYKGTINAVMSDRFKNSGAVINVTFDNFYVNNNRVEGEKTITNMGRNGDNKLVYKVVIKNGKITKSDGGIITFAATKNWTWLEGESTVWPNLSDDVWQLDGNAEGTNVDNNKYTVSTITPLRIELNCQWKIVQGKIKVVPEEGQDMTIDYGDGTCDNLATLKVGELADITIKLK